MVKKSVLFAEIEELCARGGNEDSKTLENQPLTNHHILTKLNYLKITNIIQNNKKKSNYSFFTPSLCIQWYTMFSAVTQ